MYIMIFGKLTTKAIIHTMIHWSGDSYMNRSYLVYLAKKILAFPATSAPVERLFVPGFTIDRAARLYGDIAAALDFLRDIIPVFLWRINL